MDTSLRRLVPDRLDLRFSVLVQAFPFLCQLFAQCVYLFLELVSVAWAASSLIFDSTMISCSAILAWYSFSRSPIADRCSSVSLPTCSAPAVFSIAISSALFITPPI